MDLAHPSLTTRTLSRRALLASVGGGITAGVALPRWAHAQPVIENFPAPVREPSSYLAYIPTASKSGPFLAYTCEFDAAWAVLYTYGFEGSLDEQLSAISFDNRIEPYYEWHGERVLIFGGDITTSYSGDYSWNFLCRTTAAGMRPVFEHFGLRARGITSRLRFERAIDHGNLVWIKATVDFRDWVAATWVTPEGVELPVVLGNDHAMVVMGYDVDVVVIRDILGPTDTNWQRPYEYEVPWDRFLACFNANGAEALEVFRPES